MRIVGSGEAWSARISESTLKKWSDDILLLDLNSEINEEVDPDQCIVVADDISLSDVLTLKKDYGFNHVVQIGREDFEEQIAFSAQLIAEPEAVMDQLPQAYLDPLVQNQGGELHQLALPFKSFADKKSVFDEMSKFSMNKMGLRDRVAQGLRAIADEMFTNAIVWGPQKLDRKRKYALLFKQTNVGYDDGSEGCLHMAQFGNRAILACEDPFGSLSLEKIVGHLMECYQRGVSSVINLESEGAAGAGIGFYLMVEQSSDFIVLVEKDKRTIVASTMFTNKSRVAMENVPRNIHICYL